MYTSARLRLTVAVLAGLAALLYALVWLTARNSDILDAQKLQAARTVLAGEQAILDARGVTPGADAATDDALQAALIGPQTSEITTDRGSLRSKLTATNPNFAAAVVDMLREAHVVAGDRVAIAYTGSFPALDLATIAATEAIGAEPVVVSSVGASNWGATDPSFTILDIESLLADRGLIQHRSVAAAVGGSLKRGPMTEAGRQAALAAIARNGVRVIEEATLHANVADRERLYTAGGPVKAFINVGGGQVSTGGGSFRERFLPGLTLDAEADGNDGKGLLARMRRRGIPVIHLDEIVGLAEQLRLPVAPAATPPLGEGGPYQRDTRVRLAAGLGALILVVALLGARVLALAPADERGFDALTGTFGSSLRRSLRLRPTDASLRPSDV